MGFFDNVFKKSSKTIGIGSPMEGKCIPIQEVKDSTFAEEILGKGVAIYPATGKVYAPADGVVECVFRTLHAITFTTDTGVELLIHVGLDTVKLDGTPFKKFVEDGQHVEKGTLLLEADLDKIKADGYDITSPIVVCNMDNFSQMEPLTNKEVAVGDTIMELEK